MGVIMGVIILTIMHTKHRYTLYTANYGSEAVDGVRWRPSRIRRESGEFSTRLLEVQVRDLLVAVSINNKV